MRSHHVDRDRRAGHAGETAKTERDYNMKQLISIMSSIALLSVIGCAGGGPDPMAKEIRSPKAPPSAPKPIAEPISPELRGKAKLAIEDALESSDPILRANAIEAIQNTIGNE